MAKEPKAAAATTYDAEKQYRVTLNKSVKHGSFVYSPKDKHVFRGDAIAELQPQSAIKSVEPV